MGFFGIMSVSFEQEVLESRAALSHQLQLRKEEVRASACVGCTTDAVLDLLASAQLDDLASAKESLQLELDEVAVCLPPLHRRSVGSYPACSREMCGSELQIEVEAVKRENVQLLRELRTESQRRAAVRHPIPAASGHTRSNAAVPLRPRSSLPPLANELRSFSFGRRFATHPAVCLWPHVSMCAERVSPTLACLAVGSASATPGY